MVDEANMFVLNEIIEAAGEANSLTESTDSTCDGNPDTDEPGTVCLGGKEVMLGSTACVALTEFVKDGIQNVAALGAGIGTQESKANKIVQQKLGSLT
ncbi:MAG: hypothetical protein ABIA67_01020 [Candidatus Margulisiibacteriota bacterium]